MTLRSSRMVRNRHYWSLLSLCSVLFWLTAAKPYAEPFGLFPPPTDHKRLVSVRESGRLHDTKAIPGLIAVLTEKPQVNTDLALTAIHSLAQLGAEEALPDIDTYAASLKDPKMQGFYNDQAGNYILVARARLVAEASVTDIRTQPEMTNAKVLRLYQELNLSVTGINKGVAVYKAQYPGPWHNPPLPVEIYAMREIADIVYHSSVADLKGIPIAGSLELKSDYPSQLKIQLVGLSEAKRIDWLINDLSHKKALTSDEDYEIQLVEEFGTSAGKAAFAMLTHMDSHREEYKGHEGGFLGMIHIVYEVEYQVSQVQEHFQHDPHPSISNAAHMGVSAEYVPGY
jgi:hypothetical protein